MHLAVIRYPLNAEGFLCRIVRNDYFWKPLSKGILDGNLLRAFEELPLSRQNDITRQIGTDRATILRDWVSLEGSW